MFGVPTPDEQYVIHSNMTRGVTNALASEAENRRKLAAEQRKRQADEESEERKRQHELKLEQMRIDALANRLSAYQR
jgi:tripartite-type tricarboxylate transporter receptor subunit TctC